MKKIKLLTLSLGTVLAFMSCKQESNAHDHADHDHAAHEHADHEGHEHGDDMDHEEHDMESHEHGEEGHEHSAVQEDIVLNNGEKWVVNDEMKPHIAKSEELLKAYDGDYKALAEALTAENNKLIKSCTMEGESHDELHKWLHPHLEMVKELAKTEDQAQADEQINALKSSYELYHHYFN